MVLAEVGRQVDPSTLEDGSHVDVGARERTVRNDALEGISQAVVPSVLLSSTSAHIDVTLSHRRVLDF